MIYLIENGYHQRIIAAHSVRVTGAVTPYLITGGQFIPAFPELPNCTPISNHAEWTERLRKGWPFTRITEGKALLRVRYSAEGTQWLQFDDAAHYIAGISREVSPPRPLLAAGMILQAKSWARRTHGVGTYNMVIQ